ncbi:MAG: alpha-amylase [Proteobacteria bacterium]|nr:alpha-amylase [Pseudomonadota bacterium]
MHKMTHAASTSAPTYEFHVSRKSRDLYRFDESLFSIRGNTLFTNFHGARLFVDSVNKKRDLSLSPDRALQASSVYAAGLIDEILHFIIGRYRKSVAPNLFDDLFEAVTGKLGDAELKALLLTFGELFPSSTVYRDGLSVPEYLEGITGGISNRHIVMEELIVLWLGNINPAYAPVHEFIDDVELEKTTAYETLMTEVEAFFDGQPSFGPQNETLLNLLRAPARHSPHSLTGQLDYIRRNWRSVIADLLDQILKGLDFISEEEKIRFDGPGVSSVPHFAGEEYDEEVERFSADLDWMPNLVLIAKCTYVWLDQLSKKYERNIYRLDHIPDEELDLLARRGYTGLWLIGLWERGKASQKIKQICGNPEAVASAYSLYDYILAEDLGGEEAYCNLRDRAWQRGIRLASDMVPNHMSIDSRWMVEHPDWFVQSDYSPFPSYSFDGPDLSDDDRVGIFIEDGYWNKTDAAVVFKRLDRHSGDVKYVYHGNDGTQMPWNDTAQLNYLKSEVREAVIQTILHVARKFPVIRFDAAMTLAKKHYQRLWFPLPGSGGDIPSRAEHALSKEEFNHLFPVEFWREVVDRIHKEAPDTLLMAEAFWMMEGYFVRTLGMHRVYNSAFMNMLKAEENSKYRQSIKSVLEFNPQILKRYVNFMNNPDEDTAIAQFGKDDKYFGVCMMMSTMPGLPMFGHGQIEGFTEKYGMEYRRAYWDEQPDSHLVERHEREIFPLLKKRYLYSNVEKFLLYDFFDNSGGVNENVFAYSNGAGQERSLVLYNNKFDEARGWIRYSSVSNDGFGNMIQHDLAYGLGVSSDCRHLFSIFRDQTSGLEFIRSNGSILDNGLSIELHAFKYHVFVDFRQLEGSEEKPYGPLMNFLDGRGMPSIDEALAEFLLRPVTDAFREAVNPGSLLYIAGGYGEDGIVPDVKRTFEQKISHLLTAVQQHEKLEELPDTILKEAVNAYEISLEFIARFSKRPEKNEAAEKSLQAYISNNFQEDDVCPVSGWRILLPLLFLRPLKNMKACEGVNPISEWRLDPLIISSFVESGLDEGTAGSDALLLNALLEMPAETRLEKEKDLTILLNNRMVQQYMDVNEHKDVLWFNREAYETLLFWLFISSVIDILSEGKSIDECDKEIEGLYERVKIMEKAGSESDYRFKALLEKLGSNEIQAVGSDCQ